MKTKSLRAHDGFEHDARFSSCHHASVSSDAFIVREREGRECDLVILGEIHVTATLATVETKGVFGFSLFFPY